jgi:hypothetical protein
MASAPKRLRGRQGPLPARSPQALDDHARKLLVSKLKEVIRTDDSEHAVASPSPRPPAHAVKDALSLDAQTEALQARWKRTRRLARQQLGYRRLPDPSEDVELELSLLRTATRGTVQLFNLIQERRAAQAKASDVRARAERSRLLEARSRSFQASLSIPSLSLSSSSNLGQPDTSYGWQAFSEHFLLPETTDDRRDSEASSLSTTASAQETPFDAASASEGDMSASE